eukprot:s55_g12.t4
MEWREESTLGATAGRSVQIVAEFLPQHLGNIAQNISEPLASAAADRALFTIPHSEQQEISNLVQGFAKTSAWGFAKLQWNGQVLTAPGSQVKSAMLLAAAAAKTIDVID